MAHILGEAGRYARQEEFRKEWKMFLTAFIGAGVAFWLSGFMVSFVFHRRLVWITTAVEVVVVVFIVLGRRWLYRKMEDLHKQRKDWRKGATGEMLVGLKLEEFPDNFYVVHDLKTECGNLDHVVIGPTGVFALDTKSWRGVVTDDGKGELLVNGRFEKPHVKQLIGRVMGIRDRVKALAPETDAFIQALFVFTSARVDANWGTTGTAHCIRDDQLYDYIVEDKKRRKLPDKEVKAIARAFKALAQMDPTFPERTKAKESSPVTHRA